MAFFRARHTLSSSLLRAFSSPSSSSSFSSFSSSYSSIASRSRFAFPILTEQTPPFPPSIDSPFRFLSTESSKSEEDESSEKSVEESLDSLAEESSEKSVEESSESPAADDPLNLVVDEAFIAAVEESMKNANLSPPTEEETANSAEEEKPADSSVEEESAESKDGENAPPKKKTVFLEGCDLEHWLIIMEFPKEQPQSEESMVNTYVKTLAAVLECSEEEAKTKIYSVSFVPYTGFGAQISEELSQKVKGNHLYFDPSFWLKFLAG